MVVESMCTSFRRSLFPFSSPDASATLSLKGYQEQIQPEGPPASQVWNLDELFVETCEKAENAKGPKGVTQGPRSRKKEPIEIYPIWRGGEKRASPQRFRCTSIC